MNATGRRLLRLVGRRALLVLAALTVAQAVLLVVQADLLARTLAGLDATLLAPLAAVVAARAAAMLATGGLMTRAARRVLGLLRARLLETSPVPYGAARGGSDIALVTKGIDAAAEFFTGYLPQLFAAAVIPPVIVARLLAADWLSAVIIAVTLPLVPLFGALIGKHTARRTGQQWALLHQLGGHFRDVLAGMSTLRAFGRTEHQATVVREFADQHRRTAFGALRIAFLSSLALELVAALSVALVAVPIGLRLLDGRMTLAVGLLALILAPEAYLPLRALGTRFHSSAEGMAAAESAFERLDAPLAVRAGGNAAPPRTAPRIELVDVTVRYPGAQEPALQGVSLTVGAGETVALAGSSGAGKSTLLHLLLGYVAPECGRILVDGVELSSLDHDAWRRGACWVPQRPHLFAASVAANIRLGSPDAPLDEVRAAARTAHADEFVGELPAGYDTDLTERELSAGQRQRIAIARAYLPGGPVALLDEPTAQLDRRSERSVLDASLRLLAGRTALIVAHRASLVDAADRVVWLERGAVAAERVTEPA